MPGHHTGKVGKASKHFMGNKEETRKLFKCFEFEFHSTSAFISVGVLGFHATREAKSLNKAAKRHNIL